MADIVNLNDRRSLVMMYNILLDLVIESPTCV
jgi:hypothetical protein